MRKNNRRTFAKKTCKTKQNPLQKQKKLAMNNKTTPFTKKPCKKLEQNFLQKKNTCKKKKQNKTKHNPLRNNQNHLQQKKKQTPLQKNKTLQKQQNQLQFFCKKNITEQKTEPHHSFERKPLFWKNKKNFLLKDNLTSDQNPFHVLKKTFHLTEKPQKRNYHFIKNFFSENVFEKNPYF